MFVIILTIHLKELFILTTFKLILFPGYSFSYSIGETRTHANEALFVSLIMENRLKLLKLII